MAIFDNKRRGFSMNAAELAAMESGAVGFAPGLPGPALTPAPESVAVAVEDVHADPPTEPATVSVAQPSS